MKQRQRLFMQGSLPFKFTGRESRAEAAADEVDFARFVHRMETRDSTLRWVLDFFMKWTAGFGLYPLRALGWFALLVAVGTLVARKSKDLQQKDLVTQFVYSLENSLPLFDLSQGFEDAHVGAVIVVSP
jgi:hypothetical protein